MIFKLKRVLLTHALLYFSFVLYTRYKGAGVIKILDKLSLLYELSTRSISTLPHCPNCGYEMDWEDRDEETFRCPNCGIVLSFDEAYLDEDERHGTVYGHFDQDFTLDDYDPNDPDTY